MANAKAMNDKFKQNFQQDLLNMPDDIIQLMGDSVHLLKMKRLLLQEAAQAEAQAAEAARFRRREEVSHAYSSPAPAPHLSPTGQPPSAPQPPPASSPRVAVSSSVVVAPNREIFHWGKLYPETAAVHQIVNESMDKARGRSGQELNLLSVQTFSTEAAMKSSSGIELDLDDLADVNAAHLRDSFGKWLKITATVPNSEAAAGGAATVLGSAFETLMRSQREQANMLPVPPEGNRYDHRLFQALVRTQW